MATEKSKLKDPVYLRTYLNETQGLERMQLSLALKENQVTLYEGAYAKVDGAFDDTEVKNDNGLVIQKFVLGNIIAHEKQSIEHARTNIAWKQYEIRNFLEKEGLTEEEVKDAIGRLLVGTHA